MRKFASPGRLVGGLWIFELVEVQVGEVDQGATVVDVAVGEVVHVLLVVLVVVVLPVAVDLAGDRGVKKRTRP